MQALGRVQIQHMEEDDMTNLELQKRANEVRKGIVTAVHSAKAGHPGGSLSAADMFTYLYFEEMNIDPKNPKWEERDRFVLSKGHTARGYIHGNPYYPSSLQEPFPQPRKYPAPKNRNSYPRREFPAYKDVPEDRNPIYGVFLNPLSENILCWQEPNTIPAPYVP